MGDVHDPCRALSGARRRQHHRHRRADGIRRDRAVPRVRRRIALPIKSKPPVITCLRPVIQRTARARPEVLQWSIRKRTRPHCRFGLVERKRRSARTRMLSAFQTMRVRTQLDSRRLPLPPLTSKKQGRDELDLRRLAVVQRGSVGSAAASRRRTRGLRFGFYGPRRSPRSHSRSVDGACGLPVPVQGVAESSSPTMTRRPSGGYCRRVARQEEALAAIPLETRHFEDLGRYLFEPMIERLSKAEQHAGDVLGGRTVWAVNSTAVGGGVAQIVRTLLPYWRGAGIDVRGVVLRGSAEFFRVTRSLHNQLQGQPGDGGVLGVDELATLDRAAHDHARALASLLAPGDLVVLNDPQTAAMSVPLKRAGANVIWRCHVGIDHGNELSQNAWRCLRPRLAGVDRFVFSRYAFVPGWLDRVLSRLLAPGIAPASTKNRPMSDSAASAILQHLGLAGGVSTAIPRYECTDGSTAMLAARLTILDSDGPPDWSRDPVVVSLARWDRIKDPLGILDGFLERVLAATDAHLLLAGPDANQVTDDPEAAAVLADVRERWRRLPPPARARVHLACLPLTSPEENDAMVNAIQRQAAVVVKKSLQEGFGLGLAEAMWKARPVVASAVGGPLAQVHHLHSGLLVEDPADVAAFGDAIVELLREPPLSARP